MHVRREIDRAIVHATGSFASDSQDTSSGNTSPPEGAASVDANGAGSTGPASQPNGKSDGNVYYDCANCGRPVSDLTNRMIKCQRRKTNGTIL